MEMAYTHLTKMILEQVKKYNKKPALSYKNEKQWNPISWHEIGLQIEGLSKALLKFGLDIQERAAIYSQNRPNGVLPIMVLWVFAVLRPPFMPQTLLPKWNTL